MHQQARVLPSIRAHEESRTRMWEAFQAEIIAVDEGNRTAEANAQAAHAALSASIQQLNHDKVG